MEAQGADPDAVARFRADNEADDDLDDDDVELEADDVELWPENAEAFDVFTHCHWDRSVLTDAERSVIVYHGITGSELQSACTLRGIPPEHWPAVTDIVPVMVSAALPLLNARSQ